jgi:hypothetical protein
MSYTAIVLIVILLRAPSVFKGAVGSFYGNLGGGTPLPGQTAQPLYLDPGTYSVDNGSGGKEMGGFKFTLTVPPALTWTNFTSNNTISRSSPLTVNWTGGDPSLDVYLTGSSGVSASPQVGFICRAGVSDGAITVPVSILQALPVSATVSGVSVGGLGVVHWRPRGVISAFRTGSLFNCFFAADY